MHICLYTETALPKVGGQEYVVDCLAREFLAMGNQVTVLAPRPRGSRFRVEDHRLPYAVARHPAFYSTRRWVAWYRRYLLKLHARSPFDVLHCHSVYPTGYLAALCRDRLNTPTVITSHGGDVREGNVRLQKPGLPERHALGIEKADALVAISRFTADGFRRLCPTAGPIVNIPNGVDIEQMERPAPRPKELDADIIEGRYLVFLGRLHPRKGVDVLIKAMAAVPEGGGVQLVVAGDGKQRAELESQVARLGLADRVRFIGYVAGAVKTYLLQNALAMVAPTRNWEAFPLVVLEGYAAGCPVIGTVVPGLEDVVHPGRTGWLTTPESAQELTAAVTEAFANESHTRQMGQQARQMAKNYSWRSIAERHIDLYDSLLDSEPMRKVG